MTATPNTPVAGDFVSWDQCGANRDGPERGRVVAVTPRGMLEVAAEWREDPAITRRIFIDAGNVYLHLDARPPSPSPPAAPPDPESPAETADTGQDRLRYVFCRRPRCPTCDSVRLRAYRTTRNGDDSLTRHSRCQTCGCRILLVLE